MHDATDALADVAGEHPADVLTLADVSLDDIAALLDRYGLRFELVEDGQPIPGSFWGEREAGLIGAKVFARRDTPLHSLLHEACHLIVIPPQLRVRIHTDASDSQFEEDATCYLQLLLADEIPGFGIERAFADMDAWGYSFRLGSARGWFEQDAEDAADYLRDLQHLDGLLPARLASVPD
ncbi:hypothetical protein [Lysobacter brunescens]|uniref:IrrE N-terminal-like domain-containing protein n=1 Tax=Lysobacter brunescens TaxID=262323 RepID=A0ABW2YJJ8_9GAMM